MLRCYTAVLEPLISARPALVIPPSPNPSPTRTTPSPLLKRKQMIMLWHCGAVHAMTSRIIHWLVWIVRLPCDWWWHLLRAWPGVLWSSCFNLFGVPSTHCLHFGRLGTIAEPHLQWLSARESLSLGALYVSGGSGTPRKGVEEEGSNYPEGETLAPEYEQYLWATNPPPLPTTEQTLRPLLTPPLKPLNSSTLVRLANHQIVWS